MKIFKISRNSREESLKDQFLETDSKENASRLKIELDPLSCLNAKEELNLNCTKKDSLNIDKEDIIKLFNNSLQNLTLNVQNLPIMPQLNQNNFNFKKEEFLEFFSMLNNVNNLVPMIKSGINSLNINNEHICKIVNLINYKGIN